MLYDKRWDQKIDSRNVFDLTRFRDWLLTMPRKERYCYFDNGNCLLARYFYSCGYTDVLVGGSSVYCSLGSIRLDMNLPSFFKEVPLLGRRTFGAALFRTRLAIFFSKPFAIFKAAS